jgi:hypothetical protein
MVTGTAEMHIWHIGAWKQIFVAVLKKSGHGVCLHSTKCSEKFLVVIRLNSENRGSITVLTHAYSFGSTLVTSVTADVSKTVIKCLVVHVQCFPSYQLASLPTNQLPSNLATAYVRPNAFHVCLNSQAHDHFKEAEIYDTYTWRRW